MQGYQKKRQYQNYLRESQAQTETGLMPRGLVITNYYGGKKINGTYKWC